MKLTTNTIGGWLTTYTFECGVVLEETRLEALKTRVKQYSRGIQTLTNTLTGIADDYNVDLLTAIKMFDELGRYEASLAIRKSQASA